MSAWHGKHISRKLVQTGSRERDRLRVKWCSAVGGEEMACTFLVQDGGELVCVESCVLHLCEKCMIIYVVVEFSLNSFLLRR